MNKRKKVMFLIDAIETDKAGTESQLLQILARIDKAKYECFLGCFEKTEWIRTHDLGIKTFILGTQSFYSPKMYFALISYVNFLKSNKIDIVIAFFPTSITIGVLFSKIAGVKYIISARRDMGFWYTPVFKYLLRYSNKFVDAILVNSEEVKKNVCKEEKAKPDKIDVIYNGIELPVFDKNKTAAKIRAKLELPRNAFIVGTVANLNRHVKRIDVIIDSAKYILKKHKNVYFLIIGDGQLKRQYEEKAKKLGISKNILFLGSVINIFKYLSIFDVAVNCSDSEGLSNAVLEYLAMGVPTVATDVGGNSEIISHFKNGLLVEPGNPKKMSEEIMKLLGDNKTRERLSINAIESSNTFSMELMVKKHEKFIAMLTNGG